jgi:hypothetical protein
MDKFFPFQIYAMVLSDACVPLDMVDTFPIGYLGV